jgi:hypothetical protein
MATKLRPIPAGREQEQPHSGTSSPVRQVGQSELVRLRDMVGEQHRRLRLIHRQMAAQAHADAVVEAFPARCAKPRLSRGALAHLLEEARLRLELQDSSLGAAIRAVWPERRAQVPVLRPSPGLAAYALRGLPNVPNVVFALFGKSGSELKGAVDRVVGEQQTGEPFIPVFLTDHHDFTPFRDQRLAFEYFPFVLDEAAAPDPRWVVYFLETVELTMRRWGVRQIVSL